MGNISLLHRIFLFLTLGRCDTVALMNKERVPFYEEICYCNTCHLDRVDP